MKTLLVIAAVGLLGGVFVPKANIHYQTVEKVQEAQPATAQEPAKVLTVKASWYGQEYCDKYSPRCRTSTGEKFDDQKFTAACSKRWELGTWLLLRRNGRTIAVICNDRGSFEEKYGRQIDLSKSAFEALAPISTGVIEVEVL